MRGVCEGGGGGVRALYMRSLDTHVYVWAVQKGEKSERQNTKTNAQERETGIRKTLRIGVGERAELPSLRSERARALVTEPVRAAATGRRTMWMVQWKWDAYGPLNRSETWTVRRSQDLNLRKSFSYDRNI